MSRKPSRPGMDEGPVHDMDRCGICYDRRARRLVKLGLSRRLVDLLRECGPPATPIVKTLASATPDQIAVLNRTHRQATQ